MCVCHLGQRQSYFALAFMRPPAVSVYLHLGQQQGGQGSEDGKVYLSRAVGGMRHMWWESHLLLLWVTNPLELGDKDGSKNTS